MLTQNQFDILNYLRANNYENQRKIAERINCSLGKVNSILCELKRRNMLSDSFKLTDLGWDALEPYRVKNAVIMAAGMSSRFVPLSLEKPKGLLIVKNEVLIERQIEQLREAGITDILLVLGYKKEAFFYLEDKFNVKIIINPYYNVKNNIETLYLAQDFLSNTYICSSDNYFAENVFEPYVYQSYYSAIRVNEKTNEWYMLPDEKGNVKKVIKSGDEGLIMLGHVYWSSDFSENFKKLIVQHHELGDYDNNLWEDLFADNIKNLPPMKIKEYADDVIYEFDSLDELRNFDEYYVHDAHSKILKNICRELHCKEIEVLNFKPIKEGLTNTSFVFEVSGKKYVYRHPGEGTEKIINRRHEKESLIIAKEIDVDPTFICMDDRTGWKLSRYVENARIPNYQNSDDSRLVISAMRELHKKERQVGWEFLPWEEACKIEGLIRKNKPIELRDFAKLKESVETVYRLTKGDGVKKCFCHCDTYAPNWLISGSRAILIDWEYSGNADPGCDVGGYIMDAMYEPKEAERFIREYLEEDNEKFMFHYLAYVSVISYYWFVWAMYRETCGAVMGESLHNWYTMAKKYSRYLLEEKKIDE